MHRWRGKLQTISSLPLRPPSPSTYATRFFTEYAGLRPIRAPTRRQHTRSALQPSLLVGALTSNARPLTGTVAPSRPRAPPRTIRPPLRARIKAARYRTHISLRTAPSLLKSRQIVVLRNQNSQHYGRPSGPGLDNCQRELDLVSDTGLASSPPGLPERGLDLPELQQKSQHNGNVRHSFGDDPAQANAPPICQRRLKSEFKSEEEGWKLTATVIKKNKAKKRAQKPVSSNQEGLGHGYYSSRKEVERDRNDLPNTDSPDTPNLLRTAKWVSDSGSSNGNTHPTYMSPVMW
ncbi:hypothetical protein B0H14DRAFT_2636714 [Mycena olivaceomarginata]|nr:hypothetical protein B0H14DRAFT_2636714 [Mycena olivaceomarginata]